MIAATRSKNQDTEVLLENETISKAKKILEKRKEKEKVEKNKEKEKEPGEPGEEDEIPFARVKPLPEVTREKRKPAEGEKEPKGSYRNIAPLQNDEKAISLIKEALKVPVNVTTEDLLNISEAARQELKKLLIKKRVEKTQSLMTKEIEENQNMIHAEQLPSASYEVLEEERSGIPKGSLIIGDPVEQYLGSLQPGEIPRKIVVAPESVGLRAVYPLINGKEKIESLLDGGSQIVSMARDTAIKLKIAWNPEITVHMESANKSLEETLGLAKNVPLIFGHIVIYLQVHIIKEPAYKVLLGRPFDSVTESLVKNKKNGSQTLTLTDPNTGERCEMSTYERGKQPGILPKPLNMDFPLSMN
jgi:hypothetical protein